VIASPKTSLFKKQAQQGLAPCKVQSHAIQKDEAPAQMPGKVRALVRVSGI
jgi:hypothetical protein